MKKVIFLGSLILSLSLLVTYQLQKKHQSSTLKRQPVNCKDSTNISYANVQMSTSFSNKDVKLEDSSFIYVKASSKIKVKNCRRVDIVDCHNVIVSNIEDIELYGLQDMYIYQAEGKLHKIPIVGDIDFLKPI